jgi:uncharacterized lipoprotein YddW (UPF0748 family)
MNVKNGTLAAFMTLLIWGKAHSQPKCEFRAVWVASVENIDWPSRKGLPVDSQRAEFVKLLDMHRRNGINAVVVQVRPAADAFYPSPFEPWSEWLTGRQGMAPFPYYDPLQFMIEETHKRGMEFHAWCNPYRAVYSIAKSSVAPSHITRMHPDWFVSFGGTLYFDPGNKEVQQYVVSVMRDIVKRYEIDGLHMDDYFYPYDIVEGDPARDFPDRRSFERFGNGMSIGDWRRSNVDSVILTLSRMVKEERPTCKFGISPFAIWRNKSKDPDGSDTRGGQTDFDNLYADVLLWLKNGWIDYVAPQIYFEFNHTHAPYGVLLDWWSNHCYGRQCYIGLGMYRAGSNPAWRERNQLTRQIQALRNYTDVQGEVFFSSKSFEKNPNGWDDSLRLNYFRYPALIPPMPWIDSVRPQQPVAKREYKKKDSILVEWLHPGAAGDSLRGFAVYRSPISSPDFDSLRVFQFIPYEPAASWVMRSATGRPEKGVYYFVTAVSRTNMESLPVLLFGADASP